ncbi:MAG TPA: hypothetical protein VNA28_02955 [Solirubrobacteraceae bacterium]|nr:hypothetical protein [Solirubrobacteraceae bacterium]
MRLLQRLLVSVLTSVAAVALVACGEQASEKKTDTLNGEGFTVSMPGEPKRSTQTVQTAAGPVLLTAYVTEGGEEGFSMSVAQIPSSVKGDLDGAVQGAASNVKGTARDTKKTTYQGFPARDTRIVNAQDANGNKGTVFARVILAKSKLFQLQFVQEGADVKDPPAAYPAFLASLKIN